MVFSNNVIACQVETIHLLKYLACHCNKSHFYKSNHTLLVEVTNVGIVSFASYSIEKKS